MKTLKEIIREALEYDEDAIEEKNRNAIYGSFTPEDVAEYLLAFMPNTEELRSMVCKEALEMFSENLS